MRRGIHWAVPALLLCCAGCVGNKARVDATALRIERKPSVAEEAQGWAAAIDTLLERGGRR